MKKIISIVILLFSVQILSAQEEALDKQLTFLAGRNFTCESTANKYALFFVECYKKERLDLIPELFLYWQEKCGKTEALQRAKILFSLDQNKYKDADIGYDIMDMVLAYQNRILPDQEGRTDAEKYAIDKNYFSYIPIGEDFDVFTKQLAQKNVTKYPSQSIEYAWCMFYSSSPDMIFNFVQKNKYKDSKLTYQYYNKVNEVKNMIDWHCGFLGGAWIPFGEMAEMGTHPELGVLLGGRGNRFSIDFDITIRFLNTSSYLAKQGSKVYSTDRFFGAYIGLDFGWDIFTKNKNSLLLLGGIGWDGLEPIKRGTEQGSETSFVSSYNLNFGLGFRHQISSGKYLGAQLKCNIVDYTITNIVDYKGMPLEAKLIFGFTGNPTKKAILNKLKYNR